MFLGALFASLFGALSVLAGGLPLAPSPGCGDASNLLADHNCSFTTDISGWTSTPGDEPVTHRADQGDPGPGSLAAAGGTGGSSTVIGPCVAVEGDSDLTAAARVRTERGTPYYCGMVVYQYTDAACTAGEEPLAAPGAPPRPDWNAVREDAHTLADARSAQVRLQCSGEPDFVVLFDDLYFGPP